MGEGGGEDDGGKEGGGGRWRERGRGVAEKTKGKQGAGEGGRHKFAFGKVHISTHKRTVILETPPPPFSNTGWSTPPQWSDFAVKGKQNRTLPGWVSEEGSYEEQHSSLPFGRDSSILGPYSIVVHTQ